MKEEHVARLSRSEYELAEESISEIVDNAEHTACDSVKLILDTLNQLGVSEATAETCERSPAIAGGVAGMGYALSDSRVQEHLFPIVTELIAKAGPGLKALLVVEILEPFLRAPFSVADAGFLMYMKWFLGLRNDERVRWAVDEAYEYLPKGRLERDLALVTDGASTSS